MVRGYGQRLGSVYGVRIGLLRRESVLGLEVTVKNVVKGRGYWGYD